MVRVGLDQDQGKATVGVGLYFMSMVWLLNDKDMLRVGLRYKIY